MGGGLINFPTRFLRWIKIDGDAEGDDGGGGGGGDSESADIFFSPLRIQPTHIGVEIDDNTFSIIEAKDFTLSSDNSSGGILIYSKDDLINIGINENNLNNLEIVSIDELLEDTGGVKGYAGQNVNTTLDENYIIMTIDYGNKECGMGRIMQVDNSIPVIYRLGDNLYTFNIIQAII